MLDNLRARLVPGLLLVAASVLSTASTARAEVSISVAPSLVELNATPGGDGSVELTLLNEGDEQFDLTAGVDQYKHGSGDRSAVDWLAVEPSTFTLAPGEQRQARIRVTIPKGLSSGGRYAQITFRTAAAAAAGSRVGVSGQIGVPLLIDVQASEPLVREAAIDKLVPILEPSGGLGFWTTIQSRGNLHVASRGGAIDVTRDDGSSVGQLSLPETTAILPSSAEPLVTNGALTYEPNAVYHASGSLTYGGAAPAIAEASFTARAELSLTDVSTTDGAGAGPTVKLGVTNNGELGLLPQIDLSVQDGAGHIVQSAAPPRAPLLLPGQTAEIQTQLPGRLPPGEYVLVARAQYASATVSREAAFSVGAGSFASAPRPEPATPRAQVQTPTTGALSEPEAPQADWIQPVALAIAATLAVGGVAGLLWLPAMAPLRQRFRRAARSFAQAD